MFHIEIGSKIAVFMYKAPKKGVLMKNQSIIKNKLTLFLLLSLVLTFGCAKKKSNLRDAPKQTSAARSGTGANPGTTTVIDQNAKKQADAVASKNGVNVDWAGVDKPYDGTTGDNQPFFMVVNLFKVNGQTYEMPTVHYYKNSIPIESETMYYTIDGVDVDVVGQCMDRACSEYLVSFNVSKESQNLKQVMVYVDFTGQFSPIMSSNDGSHFMNLSQFADLIRGIN